MHASGPFEKKNKLHINIIPIKTNVFFLNFKVYKLHFTY